MVDQCTQTSEKNIQVETFDCITRPAFLNSQDPPQKNDRTSSPDPIPNQKRTSSQWEHCDCPKFRSCLIQSDRLPLMDQFTQTRRPKPQQECEDPCKSPRPTHQLDMYRIIILENIDPPKSFMVFPSKDKIPALVPSENIDHGKNAFPFDITNALQSMLASNATVKRVTTDAHYTCS